MKWFVAIVIIGVALSPACKGDQRTELPEDILAVKPDIERGIDVRLMGRVDCADCKTTDSMLMEVWYSNYQTTDPISTRLWNEMGNGDFMLNVHVASGEMLDLKAFLTVGGVVINPIIVKVTANAEDPIIEDIVIKAP